MIQTNTWIWLLSSWTAAAVLILPDVIGFPFSPQLSAASTQLPPGDVLDQPGTNTPAVLAFLEGLDRIESSRFVEAGASLTRAMDRQESNAEYLFVRGVAWLLAEKIAEGRRDLARALGLRPNDNDIRLMLAFALRMQGDEIAASRFYSAASIDADSQVLLKAGHEYGVLVRESSGGSSSSPEAIQRRRRDVLSLFGQIGRSFARNRVKVEEAARALSIRGAGRFRTGDYAGAEHDLAAALAWFPDDLTSRYYHAAAAIHLRRFEQGRHEMTTVLAWKPALVEGYCQRAIAAAQMGDWARAELDSSIAAQLDPNDLRRAVGLARRALAEIPPRATAVAAQQIYGALVQAARSKASFDILVDRAKQLVAAADDHRLYGDEVYQDQRRKLGWAIATDPRNPEKLAALGRFLVDEAEVRGEGVEPNGGWSPYREQSLTLQAKEIGYARQLFNLAGRIDSHHLPTLFGLAALEMRDLQWPKAEALLRQALRVQGATPEILELFSWAVRMAADERAAKMAEAREPKTWTEVGYNLAWFFNHDFSQADQNRADRDEQQAIHLRELAQPFFPLALKACDGTALGHYYEGTLAWSEQRIDASRTAMEQAARLAPAERRIRHDLANVYLRLDLIDAALEEQTAACNLEQTTGAPWLQRAWSQIVKGDWNKSRAALEKALAVDPEDARVPAYSAVIAQAQRQENEAIACYRVALAVEEAHASLRGPSLRDGRGGGRFEELGLSAAIRLRLGQLLLAQNPTDAADLFLQNAALGDRMADSAFSQPIRTAMLPDFSPGVAVNPRPPAAGAILRKSRALAGIALTRAGQYKGAIAQFDRIDYDEGRIHGGGTAYLHLDDEVSDSAATRLASAEAHDGVGDPFGALRWLQQTERRANSGETAGQRASAHPDFQRVKQKIESSANTAYLALQNQALGEIKRAQPIAREQVRAGWIQKLGPLYEQCEALLRERQVAPPGQALSTFAEFQSKWRAAPGTPPGINGPTPVPKEKSWQQEQERFQQQRQAQIDYQIWMQQEFKRIEALPSEERATALQEFQRRTQEHARQRFVVPAP